jgi:hypothetical protein
VDVADLGSGATTGGEALTATANDPGRIEVLHNDYATGSCPLDVVVHVAEGTHTLDLQYSLIDDFCECMCQLDVSYALERAPARMWTRNAGDYGASVSVTVP